MQSRIMQFVIIYYFNGITAQTEFFDINLIPLVPLPVTCIIVLLHTHSINALIYQYPDVFTLLQYLFVVCYMYTIH